jgi:hypothetical protein
VKGQTFQMAQIRTKTEFFQLWEAGVLGNKLRTWRDPEEAVASGCPIIGFRQIGVAGGGKLAIVPAAQVQDIAQQWRAEGLRWMLCEAAPDEHATIQGEVCRGLGGWQGLLGLVVNGKRMRDSMRDGDLKPVAGVQVVDLLNRYMDPASRWDLDQLLDLYPDATVEFTCYTKEVGFLPSRNTIMWECRDY